MPEELIIDYRDDIRINRETFPIKNLHAYWGLRYGIYTCANAVRKKELPINQNAVRNGGKTVLFHTMMGMDDESAMLYNLCNWFSINVISFLRLTTLLKLMQKNNWQISDIKKKRNLIKKETKNLLRKVAPEVLLHRNKVAAHLAASDPFSDDTEGTLMSSLVSNISFSFPFYSVTIKIKPQGEGESALPVWNLTQVYEELTPRFWPDLPIPKLMLSSTEELNAYRTKFENK